MKSLFSILFFALTIIIINFWWHFFLYASALRFFQIINPRVKYTIGITLLVLSLSFIFSSMLAHYADNVFTRWFYTLSASWLGIFAYFVLFFLLLWIIIGVFWLFHIILPVRVFATVFVFIVLWVSIYWFWNASNPELVNVNITIKNLPEYWKWKTIVQISDIHLWHTLRQGFAWNIVDKINTVHPEAVFIVWDLFDGMDGKLAHLFEPFQDIIAPQGIFYVTGNHETYLGIDKALNAIKNTNVQILNDEEKEVEWLQIIGISYPERGITKNVAATLKSIKIFNPKKPSILLWHTPTQISEIAKTGVSLMLAGHSHRWQIFPFSYITKLVYLGYDYWLSQIWDFSLYTSSGVGTWWPPMRVGTIPEIVVIHLK